MELLLLLDFSGPRPAWNLSLIHFRGQATRNSYIPSPSPDLIDGTQSKPRKPSFNSLSPSLYYEFSVPSSRSPCSLFLISYVDQSCSDRTNTVPSSRCEQWLRRSRVVHLRRSRVVHRRIYNFFRVDLTNLSSRGYTGFMQHEKKTLAVACPKPRVTCTPFKVTSSSSRTFSALLSAVGSSL